MHEKCSSALHCFSENIHVCINVCLYPAFKSLGERWAAVCRWTEERWHKLQEVFMVWQQLLSDQVRTFSTLSLLHMHAQAHTRPPSLLLIE